MPAVANIVPIRRALSSTLRDAIDLYHQTFTDVTVVITRLEKLGLQLWQVTFGTVVAPLVMCCTSV